jgi:hypothetical protein
MSGICIGSRRQDSQGVGQTIHERGGSSPATLLSLRPSGP